MRRLLTLRRDHFWTRRWWPGSNSRTPTSRAAASLTLIDKAEHFDAIVFGEIAPGRWMAGSDFFRRTHRDQAAWPAESAGSTRWSSWRSRYHGNRVTLFRNGQEYAAYSIGQAQSFGDDAMVLLGLRYIGEMGEIGFFSGAIEDARIYDTALSAEQIAALVPNEPSDPQPLAWWTFEDGKAEDVMKTFPASGSKAARAIADGKLILDGSSYLWAAKDAKATRRRKSRTKRRSTPACKPCSTKPAPGGRATCGTPGCISTKATTTSTIWPSAGPMGQHLPGPLARRRALEGNRPGAVERPGRDLDGHRLDLEVAPLRHRTASSS